MANEEEPKPHISSPNTLTTWERIILPSLTNQFQSQSPIILLSDPNGRRSTPPEHKQHRTSVVFPPTNHEDLNLHHQHVVHETHNESAEPVAMEGPVAGKWWFFHFNLPAVFSGFWKFSVIRSGLLWLFNFRLIGSTVLMLLFYWKLRLTRRRRRRLREETIDGLLGVIKEKDERINHLLHQIARMNELLLASRHGVTITSRAASG